MIPEKLAKHCRDKSMAVMFCYFNQIQYFKEYLDCYEGNCVILIGPVKHKIIFMINIRDIYLKISQ